MTQQDTDEFEAIRGRLFGIAYRMLGSASAAEDVVQDGWLRWNSVDRSEIRDVGAFLARVVTNLSITALTSARARREEYVGTWLPEPILTGAAATEATESDPLETSEQSESVSMALLLLLERLSPAERAAYVLREAFGYTHQEIAQILSVSDANARQLFARARSRIGADEPRRTRQVDAAQWRELVTRFFEAARNGEVAALENLLARDATSWADGGGIVNAARNPVQGRERIARYLVGVHERFGTGFTMTPAEANGEPVILAKDPRGELRGVCFIETAGDEVTALRLVLNPDKLAFVARQLSRIEALPSLS